MAPAAPEIPAQEQAGARKAPRPPRETMRPFTLVKNLTFLSLVIIFVGTLLLSAVITKRGRDVVLKKSEEYSLLLANNLNHQIFMQFLLPTWLRYGKIQLSNKEQYEQMDKVVHGTVHGFKVDDVTIYGVNNIVSYSFNQEQVGKETEPNFQYFQALEGRSTSTLEQNGPFWAIWLGIPRESKLRTFAPLFYEEPSARLSGKVLGVFEIVQDLSDDFSTLFRFQMLIVGASAGVMCLLMLVLASYVRRGEQVLWKRAEERVKLEEQLSSAERLASLGEMTAAVSHEIRNPLGIIRSTAQLLKKRSQGAEAGLADVIVEEATRLNDIITDFLNFARPQQPRFARCRVEEIVEKNLAFLEPRLAEGHYTVNKNYQDNLPEVLADQNLLYQAFLNILINAMQAMPQGGPISIDILADGENLTVSFTDEGSGLDEQAMKRIWNPFFTTKERGTGLGLCMVKNIVEAHQGYVWIENAPVKGASVWIQIPLGC
ncbi:MAG: ATP-binding protein [Thermodesulfobacteriota bacterium]